MNLLTIWLQANFFWLYPTIFISISVFGSYIFADSDDEIVGVFLVALFWPLALFVIMLVVVLGWPFALGAYIKDVKKHPKKTKKGKAPKPEGDKSWLNS